MTRSALILIIMAGALAAPARAGSTCLVEIDGRRHVDGSCEAFRDPEGRLLLGDGRVAALVRPHLGDSDNASGAWQGRSEGRARDLGLLERDGVFCWRNARARVCAWGQR